MIKVSSSQKKAKNRKIFCPNDFKKSFARPPSLKIMFGRETIHSPSKQIIFCPKNGMASGLFFCYRYNPTREPFVMGNFSHTLNNALLELLGTIFGPSWGESGKTRFPIMESGFARFHKNINGSPFSRGKLPIPLQNHLIIINFFVVGVPLAVGKLPLQPTFFLHF